ncbi:Lipase 5 [Zalaria obscura]|uniref:Lipase 5 n=1 Tax=Zalaria obscura TaxID=2024903 RepID=A0ACC3S4B1_9PEZI
MDNLTIPGAGVLHGSGTRDGTPARPLRKYQSHASLLNPLIRFLREPSEALYGPANAGNVAETPPQSEEEWRKQILRLKLRQAESYNDWLGAATELDRLEANDIWKLEEESSEYDTALVKDRLQQLEDARISCDAERMLYLIRTSLTRGLGGMGDLRLYKHSRVGTKDLIERYIEAALNTLDTLIDLTTPGRDGALEPRNVMEQLLMARQAFGRSALLLSGGGTLGMNHIGVVKALFEAQLLPRIISGASAGSIVCAVLCTKTDAEIPAVLKDFCYGDLAVFEKEGEESVLRKAARFLKHGALFDISNLVRVMKELLGDLTFQESYNRTRRILNICVSTASLYELPRLLNYVTAPNVMIWSAVAASCSVPFVFSAAQLLAKDPRTGAEVPWNQSAGRWIDGSVDNDLPMTRLAEMFNVNHFIVSQVNPHVVPFVKEDEELVSEGKEAPGPGLFSVMANLAKSEALHRMHVLSEMGVLPNTLSKVRSVLGQRYSGDITIFPEISYTHFPRVLANPTTDFMIQAMLCGERATWPKLSRIRNHCAIELALDDAVQELRARVVFSPSQVDLRLNSFGSHRSVASVDRPRRGRTSRALGHAVRNSAETVQLPIRDRSHRRSVPESPSKIPVVPTLKIPGPSLDYTSSGHDTVPSSSAAETDDSDDPLSDSTVDSPPSPQPALWPSTRQLFPSASQPVTPSIASKAFLTPSPPITSSSPSTTRSSKRPSSPEARYKRIFHNVQGAMSTIHSQSSSPQPAFAQGQPPATPEKERERKERSRRRDSNTGLDVDISGTRGMVRRKNRSLSTGIKGLWPPKSR